MPKNIEIQDGQTIKYVGGKYAIHGRDNKPVGVYVDEDDTVIIKERADRKFVVPDGLYIKLENRLPSRDGTQPALKIDGPFTPTAGHFEMPVVVAEVAGLEFGEDKRFGKVIRTTAKMREGTGKRDDYPLGSKVIDFMRYDADEKKKIPVSIGVLPNVTITLTPAVDKKGKPADELMPTGTIKGSASIEEAEKEYVRWQNAVNTRVVTLLEPVTFPAKPNLSGLDRQKALEAQNNYTRDYNAAKTQEYSHAAIRTLIGVKEKTGIYTSIMSEPTKRSLHAIPPVVSPGNPKEAQPKGPGGMSSSLDSSDGLLPDNPCKKAKLAVVNTQGVGLAEASGAAQKVSFNAMPKLDFASVVQEPSSSQQTPAGEKVTKSLAV